MGTGLKYNIYRQVCLPICSSYKVHLDSNLKNLTAHELLYTEKKEHCSELLHSPRLKTAANTLFIAVSHALCGLILKNYTNYEKKMNFKNCILATV